MAEDDATLVLRGVLSLARRLREARPEGAVSPAALAVLDGLRRLGPVPAVRLAAALRLQPQSLTRLLDGLEAGGLIARETAEHDRREKILSLTGRGRAAFRADMMERRQWLDRAMSHALSPAEREVLRGAAAMMLRLAEQEDGIADAGQPAPHLTAGAQR